MTFFLDYIELSSKTGSGPIMIKNNLKLIKNEKIDAFAL